MPGAAPASTRASPSSSAAPSPASRSTARHRAATPAELLDSVIARVPPRRAIEPEPVRTAPAAVAGRDLFGNAVAPAKTTRKPAAPPSPAQPHDWGPVAELAVETGGPDAGDAATAGSANAGPYDPWRPGVVWVPGAIEHPTPLVQSAAMAAVPHPVPSWRPMLPERVVTDGLLSDAQLESVVLAGEAHDRHLAAHYRVGSGWETVQRCPEDGEDSRDTVTDDGEVLSAPVRFRRGWMLGDGTGAGKGRQVAAMVLDNWMRGRKRALWLSQSDKLLEDARRDWAALGGRDADVFPLGNFRQGAEIPLAEGILFATYATLRSPARQGKSSRLDQIVAWLAGSLDEDDRHAYQGVIVFDEAHAMANAAGSKGNRGEVKPSQQGRAGLRLQNALPDARIAYVSATGATTVPGLAYAGRLGLWAAGETPFETRTDFISAMEAGGVAAMEVLARDLKALGLYQARALSYDGVEVEILEHPLTPEQRRIYDAYAGAFKVIHHNIEEALKATGIVEGDSTLNKNAKSAALSAFEGAKQRFFGHLVDRHEVPEPDPRDRGRSRYRPLRRRPARLDRRGADGTAHRRDPGLGMGRPLRRPHAARDRHRVPGPRLPGTAPGALHRRRGQRHVAAGVRRRRQPRHLPGGRRPARRPHREARGPAAGAVGARPDRAPLRARGRRRGHRPLAPGIEDHRRTGRAPGAPVPAGVGESRRDRRVHGRRPSASSCSRWRAGPGAAITPISHAATPSAASTTCWSRVGGPTRPSRGSGRTHRTHQASAPLFRPVATDVKGERRFIATIARRLDSLGAITRGQRDSQTAMGSGDQALFRESDNLESIYAKAALRRFYIALWRGHIEGWSLDRFEDATGLKLVYEGNLKEELPPMPRFLNRLLALPIAEQNQLFAELEARIAENIEQAVEAGSFEVGVETVRADSLSRRRTRDAL